MTRHNLHIRRFCIVSTNNNALPTSHKLDSEPQLPTCFLSALIVFHWFCLVVLNCVHHFPWYRMCVHYVCCVTIGTSATTLTTSRGKWPGHNHLDQSITQAPNVLHVVFPLTACIQRVPHIVRYVDSLQ